MTLLPDLRFSTRRARGAADAERVAPWAASPAAGAAAPAVPMADVPLGGLLVAMCAPAAAVREAAWAACYERYHPMVWTRALYVMRTVAWLAEPREAAADVASDVFVGLPDAARHYREEGRAEWWLKQIAVRTALRRREALTGRWSSGRQPGGAGPGRSYVSLDEAADDIVARLDAVEPDELLELERRRAALRASDDAQHRRWDTFLDRYVAGYDFREIGARLGLTEGTARNWLWKIRKHLGRPETAAAERPPTREADHA
jgi:RNA polymerase sigma factor (sigma-70 family)